MNRTELCADKNRLVMYLYGECDEAARRDMDAHLAVCHACAAEVAELRSTRNELAEWAVPDLAVGFRIVSEQRHTVAEMPAPVPVRRSMTLPWWLQTSAAVLLLSAAAAISQVEVRYSSDGFVVRTGWSREAAPVAASASTVGETAPWRRELTAVEERLRRDLAPPAATGSVAAAVEPVSPNVAARAASTGSHDEALLRRVQSLIEQSEQKQQRELAVRLTDVVRDVDVQRRADQVRVQQTFGQLEGQTGVAVQQNRELLNYLVKVSQQK